MQEFSKEEVLAEIAPAYSRDSSGSSAVPEPLLSLLSVLMAPEIAPAHSAVPEPLSCLCREGTKTL